MRIFKNRGDIYIPKSGYKSSKEEQILLSLLGVVVVFTVAFVIIMGNRYDFSMKNFFASDKVIEEQQEISTTATLPAISGKSNYLVVETNDKKDTVFYAILIQADRDNIAYKATILSPQTVIGTKSINQSFADGGIQGLFADMNNYFGFDINYYAHFTTSTFKDFVGDLGTFLYPSPESFKFSGGQGADEYSVRINEGESTINAKNFSNLLRYYVNEAKTYAIPNEIVLYALVGLIDEESQEDAQELFRTFIDDCSTNITVRDFASATDAMTVFTKSTDSIKVYSCVAQYDQNFTLTQESLKDIKGYFS